MKRAVSSGYTMLRRGLQVAVVIATAGCGGPGTEPQNNQDPGFVRVSVTGPLTPEVAFKLRISGGPLDSARVVAGKLYFETIEPALHRAIVIGSPDRTRLVEFWMADRNLLDSFGVNLEEVAATGTYEQLSVVGYVATLGR